MYGYLGCFLLLYRGEGIGFRVCTCECAIVFRDDVVPSPEFLFFLYPPRVRSIESLWLSRCSIFLFTQLSFVFVFFYIEACFSASVGVNDLICNA